LSLEATGDLAVFDLWAKKGRTCKISAKKQRGFYSFAGPFGLPEKHFLNLPGTSDLPLVWQSRGEVALRSRQQTKLMMLLLCTESRSDGSSSLLKTRECRFSFRNVLEYITLSNSIDFNFNFLSPQIL